MNKLLLLVFVSLALCPSAFGQTKKAAAAKAKQSSPAQKVIDFSAVYEDEWLRYETSETAVFYFNPAKAARKGDFVRAWTEKRDNKDFDVLSKVLFEVNCADSKIRSLVGVVYFSFTEYPDGRREKVKNYDRFDTPDEKFVFIIPDSVGESLQKTVCKL